MRWLWVDRETAPVVVAELLARQLQARPESVLGLPTGRSAVPMYRHLGVLYAAGVVSFRAATTFNLDEYVGLAHDAPESYHAYMRTHLLGRVDMAPERFHIPDGARGEPEAECAFYEQAIRQAGGWDLAVLGLGRNGHIAFNEPGTLAERPTHVVRLSASTRAANRADFPDGRPVPERAITVGLGTILAARSILVLATGTGKAHALRSLATGVVDPSVPATVLHRHADVTVVADRALRWRRETTDAPVIAARRTTSTPTAFGGPA